MSIIREPNPYVSQARLQLAASGLTIALQRMSEGRIDLARALVTDSLDLLHKFIGEQPEGRKLHDMVGA